MEREEKTRRRRKKEKMMNRKRVMYHGHRCWVLNRIQNPAVVIQTWRKTYCAHGRSIDLGRGWQIGSWRQAVNNRK